MTSQECIEAILDCLSEAAQHELWLRLDDIVHDLARGDESIPLGAVSENEPGDIELIRSDWASVLNNKGAGDQLRYIISCDAFRQAWPHLEELAQSSHARLRMRKTAADVGLIQDKALA